MYHNTPTLLALGSGLLLARVVGLLMAAHGAQKLFGWFGGHGLTKTGEFFAYLGFHPGKAFATAAALGEFGGGLLVALGLLGPVGPALVTSVMVVAMITVHRTHGLFASDNGIEVPLLYMTAMLGLVLTGYGPYSLDAWLGIAGRWTPEITGIVVGMGVLGGLANVAIRRPPPTTARA
ncbi:MAG TPA: DoxX family protein [Gemmatimonadales bacterium]|nr:DoxX family protein [Gemmatimonadales bacterium]